MAQEQLVLRRIDWHEAFAFTRLFNSFRSALHSTRIIIALAGLVLTFALGCTLDWVWVKSGKGVWSGQVYGYYVSPNAAAFHDWTGTEHRIQLSMAAEPFGTTVTPTWIRDHDVDGVFDEVYGKLSAQKALASGPQNVDVVGLQRLTALKPVGPFMAFYRYERDLAHRLVLSAAQLRFTDGLTEMTAGGLTPGVSSAAFVHPGVLGSVLLMWSGLVWLLAEHWFFSALFVPALLAIWAITGGAISRAAIVQFARGERIGIREALAFSKNKFWGFFFAPLLCLGFVVAIGLMLTLGGLLGNVPYVGDIIIGLLWFLALIGGLAIAFISIGTLAGGGLFAPVVASEGSDAFDAISRGFSYLYSRPWKSLLYGATLVLYGSLCYLFLRFFIWLMLAATHAFVGLGMLGERPYAGIGADKLDAVWRMPTFMDLQPHAFDYYGMGVLGGGEIVLALLITLWTYLIWGALQSWLLSFYFTGNSIAYLLLRKDIDAIGYDEIYTEEPEAETAAAAAPASESPAATTLSNPAADVPRPAAPHGDGGPVAS